MEMANYACYNVSFSPSNNIWMADDIMIKHVPLLCLQIAYDILVSRLFYFVLKPLRVPLIIAQVLVSIHSSYISFFLLPVNLNHQYT